MHSGGGALGRVDSQGPAGEQTLQRSSGKVTGVIHLSNGPETEARALALQVLHGYGCTVVMK